MPTSIMTPPMATPHVATQGSPKVVVKANMEWSSTKLSGAKRTLEAIFSNESSSKSKAHCENDEMLVKHPKIIDHL
jgi:hypothetical protein